MAQQLPRTARSVPSGRQGLLVADDSGLHFGPGSGSVRAAASKGTFGYVAGARRVGDRGPCADLGL
jgi:hypothetical protein